MMNNELELKCGDLIMEVKGSGSNIRRTLGIVLEDPYMGIHHYYNDKEPQMLCHYLWLVNDPNTDEWYHRTIPLIHMRSYRENYLIFCKENGL